MTDQHTLADRQARLIIDNAVDYAIVGLDLQGTITSWNSGAANIMGWSGDEAIGQPASLFFTPEDVDARIPAVEMGAAIRTGRGIDERWHLKKDGSRFWANGEMMPLRNESGGLEGYVKILRDRTEQHASFKALAESEDRYRSLHDSIDEGFCLIEVRCDDAAQPIDYRFLDVNPAFERQTGLADATGFWMRDLVPTLEQHWFDVYAKVALTGQSVRFELPARALNRHYEVFAYRVGVPTDRLVAVLFSDITERRAGAEHLRALNVVLRDNEANLRLLLDTIGEGFYAVDRTGLTTTCNAAFLRMMGFARAEDVIGRRLHPIIHHSHPNGLPYAQAECPIYRAALHGEPAHVREELFFPINGDPLWVEYWATPIMQDGELKGAICTFQDITEQRHQEIAKKKSDDRRVALLHLGDALRNMDDPAAMAAAAAELVGQTLNASAAGLGQVDAGDEKVVIERDWTIDPAYALVGEYPMRDYGSYIDDLLANRVVAIGDIRSDSRTAAHPQAFDAIAIRALINAPVVEQDRLVAVFCVVSRETRDWTDEDVAFVQEIAERTRVAIARRRAEQKLAYADRLRFGLADLTERMRSIDGMAAIQAAAFEVIGTTLGVGRVGYGLVAADGETFTVPIDWTTAGFPSLAGTYRMDDYGLYAADLRQGTTVVIDDVNIDPRTASDPGPLLEVSVSSLINHPIIEQGRIVAVLYVNDPQPRVWNPEEVAYVREAADRLRQATERRRAEISLRDLNARLESEVELRTAERDKLWDTNADLLVVADVGGKLIRTSPSWEQVLGHDAATLARTPYFDLIHPDDLERVTGLLRNMLSTGQGTRYENRVLASDGKWHAIAWTLSPGPDGVTITGIGRDVTAEREQSEARERLEEQLRQSQKMEAVGQLTGGLAHDFNNLLTGIIGALELLNNRVVQGRFKDVGRYVGIAQQAANRAAALTHRLLAFSRRQTLDPKPTDVNRLMNGMEELIRRTVGPSVNLHVAAAADLWSTLVDPPQLENALLNLCINARDAMPNGGNLTVESANRTIDARVAQLYELNAGQYVTVCVSDTGTGMPPEVIAKAFDPFFTTKPLGQGTGLGLSMIYGFARQSGGQVRIHSKPGQGTNVCLYLPRHLEQEEIIPTSPDLADAPRAEEGQTVLVVDDEPSIRMLIMEVLDELGYAAIEASDGVAGLKVLQSNARIDLLVTDVGLPGGMNGRQMADAARTTRPSLKVLFITGYAETSVVGDGHLDIGMHVMTKPFAMEALASRIREIIK